MDAHTPFTISHAAEAAELSVHQVRNYVDMRLVGCCGCTQGGYRLFNQDSVARLRFIKTGLAAGLALSEIAPYLRAQEADDAAREARRLKDRIDQLRGAADAFDAQLQSIR